MTGLPRPLGDPREWSWGGPPWISQAVAAAAAGWPEVDERRLFALADQWFGLAMALHAPRADALAAGDRLLKVMGEGPAAETARAAWTQLIDGEPGALDEVPAAARQLGVWAERAGTAVEAAKFTSWALLADLAADLAVVDLASALTDGAVAPVAEVLVEAVGERVDALVGELAATLGRTVPDDPAPAALVAPTAPAAPATPAASVAPAAPATPVPGPEAAPAAPAPGLEAARPLSAPVRPLVPAPRTPMPTAVPRGPAPGLPAAGRAPTPTAAGRTARIPPAASTPPGAAPFPGVSTRPGAAAAPMSSTGGRDAGDGGPDTPADRPSAPAASAPAMAVGDPADAPDPGDSAACAAPDSGPLPAAGAPPPTPADRTPSPLRPAARERDTPDPRPPDGTATPVRPPNRRAAEAPVDTPDPCAEESLDAASPDGVAQPVDTVDRGAAEAVDPGATGAPAEAVDPGAAEAPGGAADPGAAAPPGTSADPPPSPTWRERTPLVVDDDDSAVSRTRRYDAPGGHRRPLAAQQLAIELAIPRRAHGGAPRMTDPRTVEYLHLINPGSAAHDPSRATNAVDCALAFHDTWARGRPRVAAPRVPDGYRLGDPARGGLPDGGAGRIAEVTGGAFQNLCPRVGRVEVTAAQLAVNHALRNLHAHLRAVGPGAFAFLLHAWEGGNAHVWTAVNQDGAVLYVDPLTGQAAEEAPLYGHYGRPYDGNVAALDALVLGPDGEPRPLPRHPAGLWGADPGPDRPARAEAARPGPAVSGWVAPAAPPQPDLDLLMMDAPELAAAIDAGAGVRDALRAESSAVAMLWCVRAELAAGECVAMWPPAAEAVQPDFDPARRHDPAYVTAYLDGAYAAAAAAQPELTALAARVGGAPARVRLGEPPDRATAAVWVRGWHGDAARLIDLAGAVVEVPDADGLRAVREAVCADRDVTVVAVEDGLDGHAPGGYPDIRMAVRTGGGHVGLLRLCLRDLEDAERYGSALGALRADVLDDGEPGPVGRLVADGLRQLAAAAAALAEPGVPPSPATGARYFRWRLTPVKILAGAGPAGWRLSLTTGGWERMPNAEVARLAGGRDRLARRLDRPAFVQEVEAERARLLRGVGPAAALYAVTRAIRQRATAADRTLSVEERAWVVGISRRTYALTEADLADRAQPGADPRPEVGDPS